MALAPCIAADVGLQFAQHSMRAGGCIGEPLFPVFPAFPQVPLSHHGSNLATTLTMRIRKIYVNRPS
jgi:hypothetical protein